MVEYLSTVERIGKSHHRAMNGTDEVCKKYVYCIQYNTHIDRKQFALAYVCYQQRSLLLLLLFFGENAMMTKSLEELRGDGGGGCDSGTAKIMKTELN